METDLLALTADIVAAHVSNNPVPSAELPKLIESVFSALNKADHPAEPEAVKQEPAVSIRASVKHDYLVCLEDGTKLKMLKRYLRTNFDMTPEQYRAKWGLPADYPMVAPAYADTRRSLAVSAGLGRKQKLVAAPTDTGAGTVESKDTVAVDQAPSQSESPSEAEA